MDILRLQQKLDLLRDADQTLNVFGSATHRYVVQPCLDETSLQAIEAQHQIHLPDEYRQFLLHIGNGGAGPYNGLASLEQALASTTPDELGRPFPYTHWWNGMIPPNWFDLDLSPDELEHLYRAPDYAAPWHVQGTLCLAFQGCGYADRLVVMGGERGYMWCDARAGDGGIGPLPDFHDDRRVTFGAWYEAWLDASLTAVGIDITARR
jgi:hypothetical protein